MSEITLNYDHFTFCLYLRLVFATGLLYYMYEVKNEELHSKSKNSPYDGQMLYGKVITTIKGGTVTFQIEE